MTRLKTAVDIVVTILIVIAASLVIWRQFVPPGQSDTRDRIEDVTGTIPAELAVSVRGTGQVALVEFADFECSFCGRHARDVEPQIRKAFIDTEVVRQVFLNFPLENHRQAEPAGAAAFCAGNQGKFWEMHDALFQNQAALQHEDLMRRARELGLDLAIFSRCIDAGEARPVIERHERAARSLGVQSTPVFFVGILQADGSVELKKRINGARPYSEFYSAIKDVTPRQLRDRIRDFAFRNPSRISTAEPSRMPLAQREPILVTLN
jgi:protein-disulfide isomerase